MDLPKLSPFQTLMAACVAEPDRIRFLFLEESGPEQKLSGTDILLRSLAFANGLRDLSGPGDRILLPYPAGLDFIIGFLGCLAAKRIPVPANYPKPRRPSSRYQTIADNCGATLAVSTNSTLRTLDHSEETGLSWFSAEEIEARGAPALNTAVMPDSDLEAQIAHELEQLDQSDFESSTERNETMQMPLEDILFLQYTSGSTSRPKGVMITSANLFANLRTISYGFGLDRIPREERIVGSWLPAYHDMGLVGVILSTLMHDGQAILMSPSSFLRRPGLWLESIERYRARITVAPCFGYQWAASRISETEAQKLDLSHLELAACGAEPISPAMLQHFAQRFGSAGFRTESFYPCYGLAEATLMVSGDHRGADLQRQSRTGRTPLSLHFDRAALRQHRAIEVNESEESIEVVHCGMPGLQTEIALASQESGERCDEGEIGEIVVSSPSTAPGYWNAPESTRKTFQFCFPGESKRYLRTGDMGFMCCGRLFVTGRRKELIIIAGQNFYPHDIEQTVAGSHPALRGLPAAAFAIAGDSTEQLVLVQEVPRGIEQSVCDQIIRKMRLAVASTHELAPIAILLVRPASIPRTSSGKVQRLQTCDDFRTARLKTVATWEFKALDDPQLFRDLEPLLRAGNVARVRARIEDTLLRWVAAHSGEETEFVRPDRSFAEMGLDSLLSVQLVQEFEQWLSCSISPVAIWSYPTPAQLADFLLSQVDVAKQNESRGEIVESVDKESDDGHAATLAAILDQLEQLDEADARALLDDIKE